VQVWTAPWVVVGEQLRVHARRRAGRNYANLIAVCFEMQEVASFVDEQALSIHHPLVCINAFLVHLK